MSQANRSNLKKWALGVAATCVVSVGFTGLLHTSLGKPLLMKLGGCPVVIASESEVEKARNELLQRQRGSTPAPKMLALGFALSSTTLTEVEEWASTNHIACRKQREGTVLVCSSVPASAFKESLGRGPVTELLFAFRLRDKKLASVAAWRTGLDGEVASSELGLLSQGLLSTLGEPQVNLGGRTAIALTASAYATTVIDYKFRDYTASVTTTNIPGDGVSLREEYFAID